MRHTDRIQTEYEFEVDGINMSIEEGSDVAVEENGWPVAIEGTNVIVENAYDRPVVYEFETWEEAFTAFQIIIADPYDWDDSGARNMALQDHKLHERVDEELSQ